MVSLDRGGSASSAEDRGQLILVGAIAMALIVIGLVLVINTALFTDVVGSEGTVEGAKGAGVASEEIEDSVGQVVHEENRREAAPDTSAVETTVEDHLKPALLNSTLDGSGAYVNVTYEEGNERYGTYVFQSSNASTPTITAVPNSLSRTEVGHLKLGLVTGTGDVTVEVSGNGGGSPRSVRIGGSTSGNLTIDPDGASPCTATGVGSFLWVDLRRGVDASGQCHFDLFQGLEGPYRFSIEDRDTDSPEGQYELIVAESTGAIAPCSIGNCHSAIWSYELAYTYETVEVTAESDSQRVFVYE